MGYYALCITFRNTTGIILKTPFLGIEYRTITRIGFTAGVVFSLPSVRRSGLTLIPPNDTHGLQHLAFTSSKESAEILRISDEALA